MTTEAIQRRAERRRATVMFVDLIGFTAMSEAVGAERAYAHVTGCTKLLDEIARRHGGSVDKYLGDAMMAVFGYPLPRPDASAAAVRAALEMRQRVEDYNREAGLELPLGLCIGINTGGMIAGDIRGPVIREFHVLGDTVNTAARLKGRAPAGSIYVGSETWSETRSLFETRPLEPMSLKGKARPVPVYAVDAPRAGAAPAAEVHLAPLVGRDAELARLEEGATRLAGGRGGILGIVGEAGVGKSRLLAALREAPACRSLQILHGYVTSVSGPLPFSLFAGIVRKWAGVEDDAGGEAIDESIRKAALRSLDAADASAVEALRSVLAVSSENATAAQAPAAVGHQLQRLVQSLTAEGPLVLILDELQWADPASLEVAASLAAVCETEPLLLVLGLREAEDRSTALWSAICERHPAVCETLKLDPLSPAAARALAEELVEDDLPPEAIDRVVERAGGNPGRLVMGAVVAGAVGTKTEQEREERTSETERRRSTVLFADITGFTAMSEKLEPEQAYPIVADCLALLDGIARKHGGIVDKYLGDCVLALFGVPRAMEDAPRAAVNAAIEMVQAVRRYSEDHELTHPLDVHVGVNTGLGISGDISGPLMREFAVMGDPVSIASQLTDHAAAREIYVGAETHRFTRDDFEYRPAESIELKDRREPVEAFELVSRSQQIHRARVGAGRRVYSPLVGRDTEMEAMRTALDELRAGRGSVISLVAEAGVGKSRLVTEMAALAASHGSAGRDGAAAPAASSPRGVSWREGRSISTGQTLSYHPFADLLRSWAAVDDDDDDDAASARLRDTVVRAVGDEADDLVPLIGAMMGAKLSPAERERLEGIQGDVRERMIRSALIRMLAGDSQQAPLVVVLDDLHWADHSSIELLELLLRSVEDHAIVFLLVFRPGYPGTSGRIREFAREHCAGRAVDMELAPLDARAAREMIKNLFQDGDVPHATRTLIEEKANGNPFYIEEVVRSLLDQGAVEFVDGSFFATEKIHAVEIPGSVHEVIMARVDRLSLRKRSVLQVASVVGQSFHQSILEEFQDDAAQLDDDLAALLEAEFLVPWDRLQGVEYAFKHPLIQEVTYDGVTVARREELHRGVALAIETRLPADVAGFDGMLAFHFSMGRDAERAEEYLFRAGDEAARVAASSEALHFFKEASRLYFELHGEGGDPAKKALLEKNVGLALYNRGQLIEASERFNAALRQLGEKPPETSRGLALRFGWNMLALLTALYVPGTRRRRAATDTDREVIDVMMKRAEAQTTASSRFLFDTMDTLARLDHIDARTVPGSGGMFASVVGIFAYGGLSFSLSQRFLDRAAPLVVASDANELLLFRTMRFLHHLLNGDWSDEYAIDDDLVEEGLRGGRLWPVTNYLNLDGLKRIYQGDYAGARDRIDWLRRIADRFEHDLAASAAQALEGILRLERRELPEALAALEDYYDDHDEHSFRISALGNRAQAQLLQGDLAAAEDSLERAARYVEEAGRVLPYHKSSYLRARFGVDVALLEAEGGARRRALQRRAASARKAALSVARKVAWRQPEVLRVAGTHAWLSGHPKEARDWWGRAVETCERLGARPDLARTHLEIARRTGAAGVEGLQGRSPQEHRQLGVASLTALGLENELESDAEGRSDR